MNTTRQRWQRVKTIASAALDLNETARDAFVDEACGDDAALCAEVRSLLRSAAEATPFFESPVGLPAAGSISAGSRIGAYRIVRELASGGMGSVFLAERDDGEFRQRVAIKLVRGGFANTFLLERFREERRILASLDHPNIARLFDGGTTAAGLPYVVMEFVEGEPIDAYCAGRMLPLRERLVLFQQVCSAVQYAHQHLVVHRDIKASNILVGPAGVPKLLDFGIAKLLDTGGGAASAYTAVRMMTPQSASPEQLAGRPVTVVADVYALGVLLYHLLAGCSPYKNAITSDTDLVRAVCEEMPDPPSTRGGPLALPADVDVIVLKALRKEPERRYGSAAEMSDDIRRYLHGLPVLASADSLRYRAGKFVSRHRVAVAATAALALTGMAGVAATVWQARVAEYERSRAERQFQAVRGLAQAVLGELHDSVQKLPGSTAAREILLRRGTEYLDALANETRGEVSLTREVADGYIRLATVQGTSGLANIGDREAARTSLGKAVALLEPIAGTSRGELVDRTNLAMSLLRLAAIDPTIADAERLRSRARAILESLTAAERSTAQALNVRQVLWSQEAQASLRVKDYEAARAAYERSREAAEEAFAAAPQNLDASRNLSLVYKQLGATLEMLKARPDAVTLYSRALELDRRRVETEPSRPMWRLDLSFALGSLGAALMAEGDVEGARAHYEEAVALREQVVAEDPEEDFAKVSLARGYERLALIHARRGAAATAIEYGGKRLQVYRERLDAHPERDSVWSEYTQTAFAVAQSGRQAIEGAPLSARERAALVSRTAAVLEDLAAVQSRWTPAGRGRPLPPTAAAVSDERARLTTLMR